MSVIGNFSIPASSFVLDDALREVPEMTVEGSQLTTHSSMEVLPFLWVTDCDLERGRQAIADDSDVVDCTTAGRTDEGVLLRLQWVDAFHDLVDDMVDHHAAVLEAVTADREWHLTLRFADEEQVSTFQRHFRETGRAFEVNHLEQGTEPDRRTFGLTPEQYETLVLAVEDGYYAVPRETSAERLGEQLDVSANAVSQRLRRGNEALLRNALRIDDRDDDADGFVGDVETGGEAGDERGSDDGGGDDE